MPGTILEGTRIPMPWKPAQGRLERKTRNRQTTVGGTSKQNICNDQESAVITVQESGHYIQPCAGFKRVSYPHN